MKNAKQIVALTLLVIFSIGCSGDDDQSVNPIIIPAVVVQGEDPLPGFILARHYDYAKFTYIDDNNYYEMGYTFAPLVNGKINGLVIQIPNTANNLRVRIWDMATETAIRTELVDITHAYQKTIIAISPLALQRDKVYGISMNTKDYFFRNNAGMAGEPNIDPVVVGNISVSGAFIYMGSDDANKDFSQIVNGSFGDCSIKFEPTQ
jgi:hypothetical protein